MLHLPITGSARSARSVSAAVIYLQGRGGVIVSVVSTLMRVLHEKKAGRLFLGQKRILHDEHDVLLNFWLCYSIIL